MSGVETLTFGCRLNAYESEVMKAEAEKAGLGDVLIVNTCAVTAESVRQAKQQIRKAKREVARIKTLQREREIAAAKQQAAKSTGASK